MQVGKPSNVQVCWSASLQVCKPTSLQVYRSVSLQVCRSVSLQSASLQVCISLHLLHTEFFSLLPSECCRWYLHCPHFVTIHFLLYIKMWWTKQKDKLKCIQLLYSTLYIYSEANLTVIPTLPILPGVSQFLVQSPCLPIFLLKSPNFSYNSKILGKIFKKQLLLSNKWGKWVNLLKENDLNFHLKCVFWSYHSSDFEWPRFFVLPFQGVEEVLIVQLNALIVLSHVHPLLIPIPGPRIEIRIYFFHCF